MLGAGGVVTSNGWHTSGAGAAGVALLACLGSCRLPPAALSCQSAADCPGQRACVDGLCDEPGPVIPGGGPSGGAGEGEGEGVGSGEGEGEGDADGCSQPGAARTRRLGDHCYAAFDAVVGCAAAAVQCAALGGTLAVPTTEDEAVVVGQLQLPGLDPCLGLGDFAQEPVLRTFTGEPVGFLDFLDGQPDNNGGDTGEGCVHLWLRSDGTRGWNDVTCDGAVASGVDALFTSALCELPPAGGSFCGDGVLQPGLGETCDDGPAQGTGSCPVGCSDGTPIASAQGLTQLFAGNRLLLAVGVERDFAAARGVCATLGAELAVPDTGAENEEVLTLARRFGRSVWVGYSDQVNEAGSDATGFVRLDTEALVGGGFTAFADGEPNNHFGEDCVEQRVEDGLWNDLDCAETRAFVCELYPAD